MLTKSPSALNQGRAGADVPLILWGEGKRYVGFAGRDESKLVGDRSHGANLILAALKLLPLAAFHFAAAGENQRRPSVRSLAWLCGLPVIE